MKKRWIISTTLAAGLVLVLAGCGNHSSDNSGSGSLASDQVLNLSADAPLDTIDIAKATGYGQTGNVFESLYRLGKNGTPIAGLASSGKVSKDGKTWTFKIRKNAKFSNGQKITAKDFVYSWQRTLNPNTKSQYAYLFSGIQNADKINSGKLSPSKLGVSAPDSQTFVVHLDEPIAYFKALMTYPLFSPVSKKVVDKYGSKYATTSKYMVYTGPFKMTGWSGTNDHWSFVKNNQYWDKSKVKLSKINYSVNENPSTVVSLYQSKKLDMAQLSSAQIKNFKSNSDYQTVPYSITRFLAFNFKSSNAKVRKAMNNKHIRQAISLAVDRKQLINKVIGDASTTPKGFVPTDLGKDPKTGKDFADEAYVKDTVNYNSAEAKKLWKQGMKEIGEKTLDVTLMSTNDADDKNISEYFQVQLQKELSGMKVNLENIPSKVAYSRAAKGDFDIYVSGWGADFTDPISHLQVLQSNSGYNYGKWSNSEYDQLVKNAQNKDANDKNKRWEDMIKADQLVVKQAAIAPLYQTNYSFLVNPKLKGVIHNTAGTQWNYKTAYIEK
ncbi:peptide ABC transporter substrate-binding protein [Pediococcus inopinatus]|uniref:peptide ABC transporter substrate-binding protein n=1 Tax=Pediococcus inopinatus TaxID=114090 RepID=UPI002B263195|nr:peptide ABC transporter substrate-binding protein [Pediococcus inopinatus]WPC17081.1 peptide ABC transporter substrate-binding protein [Pediococcus inopinatus]